MSAKALVVLGLAGVGLFLANRKASAAPEALPPAEPKPKPAQPESEPEPEPVTESLPIPPKPPERPVEPPEPGEPPSGSGDLKILEQTPNPDGTCTFRLEDGSTFIGPCSDDPWIVEKRNMLPAAIQNINLTGNEIYQYLGKEDISGRPFNIWTVHHSINDQRIDLYVQYNAPWNWIAIMHYAAVPEAGLPIRYVVYKVQGGTQKDRDWLAVNIARKPSGSITQDAL